VHGNELWLSDGTPEGTRLVKDIISGPDSPDGSDPRGLGAFEGVFYFSADDHEIGRELWRSDGTAEGTRLVKNLASGSRSSRLSRLVLLGDERFCLSAVVFDDVTQLWCGDNTSELSAVDGQDSLFNLTAVGRRLFYIGNDEGRLSLRRTDGTLAGTRELLRAIPERPPFELVAVGRTLFFRTGTRLWKSDGTTEGTVVVEELGSEPLNLVALGSRLFFTLEDAEHGREWWVSDGTSEGTVLFADLAPGHTSSAPAAARVVEGLLFFSADTPGHGREPWVSDGTPTGTRPLDEVAPGDTSSSPMGFIRSGWDVFFSAGDGMHGEEPWALPFQPEDECAAKSR
jgi:ELWxxDGT repeat protein